MKTPLRSLLSLLACSLALCAAEARKPNILIILADDLGYGDVRANNPTRGKIPTPHLDKLASQGMRFTDGHSSSGVCSPSRYALLTGRYHWRTRLQTGIVGVFGEPLIAPERLTVAGLAKQHGYRTAAIGKWHLGWDWPIAEGDRPLFRSYKEAGKSSPDAHRETWRKVFEQKIAGGPTTRGFDTTSGPTCPTGRLIASSRTTARSGFRACRSPLSSSATIWPVSRGRRCRTGSSRPSCPP